MTNYFFRGNFRQHSIQAVIWLLLITLIQIYRERKQKVRFREKRFVSQFKVLDKENAINKASVIVKEINTI